MRRMLLPFLIVMSPARNMGKRECGRHARRRQMIPFGAKML
jgi:hypothetical protein